jgi:hypothetical protein
MLRYFLAVALMLFALASDYSADDDLLKRVPQLQETARRASHGALGCGVGTVTLITSRGRITVETGLDPIHVFGKVINVSDLLALLQSRVESNHTGGAGPMSGEVDDLCYVILEALALAQDPQSIPTIAALLTDNSEMVCRLSGIALCRIAKSSAELRSVIKGLNLPADTLACIRKID